MTSAKVEEALSQNLPDGAWWDTQAVHELILREDSDQSLRSTERFLEQLEWLPKALRAEELKNEDDRPVKQSVTEQLQQQAKRSRQASLVVQIEAVDNQTMLVVNDGRLARKWIFLGAEYTGEDVRAALSALLEGRRGLLWPALSALALFREWVEVAGTHRLSLAGKPGAEGVQVQIALTAYQVPASASATVGRSRPPAQPQGVDVQKTMGLSHLDRLEAESIHIMREVVAQAENPVMLYSVGKDSSAMLHLARKAFSPSPPPFPLMHVDTRWKFQAMYDFRNNMAAESGMELIVHINPEGVARNINPFDHGSAIHTDVMKTQGLKQALDQHKFDVAFGGARRDEEKSRAKERIFSFRTANHRWDPKNQRPELWRMYNGYKNPGESIRVFPLSNWTELDIWQYIYREQIPIVPLYFAAERPVVERDGMLLMVDDDRLNLHPEETIEMRQIRFRTLGCYPLTGAIDSDAKDLSAIVLELLQTRTSERQGRAIDSDGSASMEKKKQEGYF